MKEAYAITVSGRVQGVGFRWMTKLVADKLHIIGTVANRLDGSVYIEAVGEPENMSRFIAAVKASPSPSGFVSHYSQVPLEPVPPFTGFRVIAW